MVFFQSHACEGIMVKLAVLVVSGETRVCGTIFDICYGEEAAVLCRVCCLRKEVFEVYILLSSRCFWYSWCRGIGVSFFCLVIFFLIFIILFVFIRVT